MAATRRGTSSSDAMALGATTLRARSDLSRCRIADGDPGRLGLMTHQQMERGEVRDHQQRNINDRYRVGRAQLAGQLGKAQPDAVVVIDDEVDDAHEAVGKDKWPEEHARPCRKKRKHGEYPRGEVAIGRERREAGWQVGADDARQDEDESEEAETVQRGYRALRLDPIHRPEPGPDVRAEAKQPREVAENEMQQKDGSR